MSKKSIMLLVTLITILSTILAACGPSATEAPAVEETTAPEQPAAEETEAPAAEKFTIGISNPFISSEYRTQMIAELQEVNQEYMDAGITNELVIESADTDVAGQIQQLQNLMAKNVDAILVNPGDVSGLNATYRKPWTKHHVSGRRN
jgi:ribose transport system substrate-binding protein